MITHPFAWIYAAGMVGTAAWVRLDKRNLVTITRADGTEQDWTTIFALGCGLLWMIWWPWWIAIHLYGRDKYMRWVAAQRGGRVVYYAGEVELPGPPEAFPAVDPSTVRAARLVGPWSALLTHGLIAEGQWASMARRPGMPTHPTQPELQAVVVIDHGTDEPAAREAFRWLVAPVLEDKYSEGWDERVIEGTKPETRGVDFRPP